MKPYLRRHFMLTQRSFQELEQAVESKEKEVEMCITEVRAYLMRHDLRPTLQTNYILSHKEDTEEQREADFVQGFQMQSDCDKLENDWKLFIEQLSLLSQVVHEAHKEISDLSNALAEALLTVGGRLPTKKFSLGWKNFQFWRLKSISVAQLRSSNSTNSRMLTAKCRF